MISDLNEVGINCILHQILNNTECELKTVIESPNSIQKIYLSRSLYMSKIKFARFLVLYRWSKLKQINLPQNDSANNHHIKFGKLFNETVSGIHNLFSSFNFPDPSFKSIKQNFVSISKILTSPYDKDTLLIQLLCQQHVHRINSFHTIKHYTYIDALPSYAIILKYNQKGIHIHKLKLYSKKKFDLPSQFILSILTKIGPVDLRRTNELRRIDSILYPICVINSYIHFIDQIYQQAESFGVQVVRTEENSIKLLFPDCYKPFNCFTMKLLTPSYHIEIFSTVPLSFPPKDPTTIYEAFEKLYNESFIETKLYHRIVNPIEPFNPNVLLCELRDMVFYTRVRRFWEYMKRSIRSAFFSHFKIVLSCEKESILFIKILFYNHRLLITIEFDSNSGLPIFKPISDYYQIEKQPRFPDVERIFTSVFTRFIEHLEMAYIFKPHIFYLIRPFHLYQFASLKYLFSFSDHYFVQKHHTTSYPIFSLHCVDNPTLNLNPRTILIKSINNMKLHDEIDELVNYISLSSKIFVILSELERKLKEKGILCKRHVNLLYIIPFSCRFKIDYSEYWTLTFEKMLIQFQTKGKIVIRGNRITLRFIDSIIDLMQNVFRVASMTFQAKFCLEYSNEFETFLKPFGYHYAIFLDPIIEDYYNKESVAHFLKLVPFRHPKLKCTPLKLTPLAKYVDDMKCYDSFASYVHTTIFFQMKICHVFNSKNWKIIPGACHQTVTLVYKDIMSIILFRILDDMHYLGYVADHGKSCFLLAPLSNLFKVSKPDKSRVAFFKGTIFEIEKIRNEIEMYDDYIDVCNTMMIDTFNYMNGKVIGKAVRFYLVNVVIDSRGMIASTASFPALEAITNAVYRLDSITFQARKKIVVFIYGIIKCEVKAVINFLHFFKILTFPDLIQKINWQEMSQDLFVDPEKATFQFSIVENDLKVFIRFNDPMNKTVTLSKDGISKTIKYTEFENLFTNINLDMPIISQLFS